MVYTNLDDTIQFKINLIDSGPSLGYLYPWTEHQRTGTADHTIHLDLNTHETKKSLTYDAQLPAIAALAGATADTVTGDRRFEKWDEIIAPLLEKRTVLPVDYELFANPDTNMHGKWRDDSEITRGDDSSYPWNSCFFVLAYNNLH